MAAAEYFNPSGSQPNPHPGGLRPPSMASTLPYPMSDAPPPYSAIVDGRPHSQPPPTQRPPPLDQYYQQAPPPPNAQYPPPNGSQYPPPNGSQYPPNGSQYPPNGQQYPSNGQQYPPDKASRPPLQQPQYRPQSYAPPPQQGYFSQPGPSSMRQSFSRDDRKYTTNAGYAPVQPHVSFRKESPRSRSRSRERRDQDRDRSRSRSRSRDRRHRHRQQSMQKKKSGVDTFIGAGGGALIGDALFPGLGTLGGAILGGWGGHKVAKDKEKERRAHSNNSNNMRGRSYSNDGDYYYADDYRRGRKY